MIEPGRNEEPLLMLEVDHTPNPLRDDIFNNKVIITKGNVQVPDEPGLGVEINLDAMLKFCIHQTEKMNGK